MFNGTNGVSLADIAAATGNGRNNDGMWGGDGWWFIIVLFVLFGGFGGNGWGGNGSNSSYYTDSAIQRGFDNQAVLSKLDGITNGLCDGFYAVNNGMLTNTATLQNAIQQNNVANMQNTNAIQSQLAQCCCNNWLESLQNANTTQNMVSSGFADVGYRMATLRSAAKKAFDEYKKHHGQDSKLPRISELNAEYAAVLERKKKNYAEYAKSKLEMQEWLTAQKIVQTVLGEEEKAKQQQHEQEVHQEENR